MPHASRRRAGDNEPHNPAVVRLRTWLCVAISRTLRIVPAADPARQSCLEKIAIPRALGVSEGTRTPDRRDHNPELYQLSYAHQAPRSLAANPGRESVVQKPTAGPPVPYV